MNTIAIIDYGMGNLHSIGKAVEHAAPGCKVIITADRNQVASADRVIFPGVGGIRHCMDELNRSGLDRAVLEAARTKPLLGICIGLQAMLEDSEENGGTPCLGLFAGHVRRFSDPLVDAHGQRLKVPHMGWNEVHQHSHPLWSGIEQDSRFYFVHSYRALADDEGIVVGETDYGGIFASALASENLFAVQFHPEKSQHAGLKLLANFAGWDGRTNN
jgi:glutamine amidotransferase